ncbi:MAG: hypothetical protein JRC60_07735 [Deltaproteobacteria bacterium]|nr:hypothetical protein [Deltaproteobacteria bacterium]
MKTLSKLVAIAFIMSGLMGCAISQTKVASPSPTPAIQKAGDLKLGIMDELEKLRPQIKKDLYVTVGSFMDKSGQFKDSDMLRYSRAVTQGSQDILYDTLYTALGPGAVLDRDGENMRRIYDEYQKSHIYDKEQKQIGLIQRGGPQGGLTGARYMVTGSVVYYHVDRYTGGGGVNVDGIGANFQTAIARVGVSLRLVDMNTSEIRWSTLKESGVSGTKVGIDIFRFITSNGHEYLVQTEAGFAAQIPADYALQDCLATAVYDMVASNKAIFLKDEKKETEKDKAIFLENVEKQKETFLDKLEKHEKKP